MPKNYLYSDFLQMTIIDRTVLSEGKKLLLWVDLDECHLLNFSL